MIITVPAGWVEVSLEDFERHLLTCNDYYREGYAGAAEYHYLHNRERFAIVRAVEGKETVYAPPHHSGRG